MAAISAVFKDLKELGIIILSCGDQLLSQVQFFAIPWTFPRKNTGVFPPPGNLPNPGFKHVSPALAGGFYHSSIQFSGSVVSHSLQPHGLQHAKLPCTSATPRVYSNSCPLSG